MKRRDFVRTAVGIPLLPAIESYSSAVVSYENEEDFFQVADNEYAVHFIALGDWGRNGEYLQKEVAEEMGRWATKNRTHFVISTGDNFYPKGVVSELDPLWHYSFEDVYRAHSLQCDWYAILGNHDYGADPDAQVRYTRVSRRWKMPSRYYFKEVSLGRNKGSMLLLMLDTNSLIDTDRGEETARQLEWMTRVLGEASKEVKWKIVVGHHPAYTVGPRVAHRHVLLMRDTFAAIFDKYGVDFYLSGHEHSLQHIKPESFPHQFISGAGSELTPVTTAMPDSEFEASVNGFMYASVGEKNLRIKMIDYRGELLYETILSK